MWMECKKKKKKGGKYYTGNTQRESAFAERDRGTSGGMEFHSKID